jgi:uncharacterized LabA/DUF88 family protein
MFTPKTDRIKKLAGIFPDTVGELKRIFDKPTNVYIDWQNVIHWQERVDWHFHQKRLKQLLDSFDTIRKVSFYTGTFEGNQKSEESIQEARDAGYDVRTKPVKKMKIPIDVSGIPRNSPAVLASFVKKSFLSKLDISSVEFLNGKLAALNKQGEVYIEEYKCNFDVEIGRDMLIDFATDGIDTFVLWSGDSDFADPIMQLRADGKNVYIFATARKVSYELNEIKVPIFEVRKIKEFVCWPREIPQAVIDKMRSIL